MKTTSSMNHNLMLKINRIKADVLKAKQAMPVVTKLRTITETLSRFNVLLLDGSLQLSETQSSHPVLSSLLQWLDEIAVELEACFMRLMPKVDRYKRLKVDNGTAQQLQWLFKLNRKISHIKATLKQERKSYCEQASLTTKRLYKICSRFFFNFFRAKELKKLLADSGCQLKKLVEINGKEVSIISVAIMAKNYRFAQQLLARLGNTGVVLDTHIESNIQQAINAVPSSKTRQSLQYLLKNACKKSSIVSLKDILSEPMADQSSLTKQSFFDDPVPLIKKQHSIKKPYNNAGKISLNIQQPNSLVAQNCLI